MGIFGKRKADGSVEKYKARKVEGRFTHDQGVNYDDTYVLRLKCRLGGICAYVATTSGGGRPDYPAPYIYALRVLS